MTDLQQVASGGWVALLWLVGPPLVVTFAVGLMVSITQAVTQIQESSLSFAPKFAALILLLAVAGGLMFHGVIHYAQALYHALPVLVANG